MFPNRLSEVLSCAVDYSRRLGEKCGEFPRSTEKLIDLVAQDLSAVRPFSIIFHPVIYEASRWIGKTEIWESEAHIYYDLNRSFCWRRLVITKELCHVLYFETSGKREEFSPDSVEQLIDTIIAGLEKADLNNDSQAQSETVTVFMALEILLPHSERKAVIEMVDGGEDVMKVAEKYRIPVQFVRLFLTEVYCKLMDDAYRVNEIARAALETK